MREETDVTRCLHDNAFEWHRNGREPCSNDDARAYEFHGGWHTIPKGQSSIHANVQSPCSGSCEPRMPHSSVRDCSGRHFNHACDAGRERKPCSTKDGNTASSPLSFPCSCDRPFCRSSAGLGPQVPCAKNMVPTLRSYNCCGKNCPGCCHSCTMCCLRYTRCQSPDFLNCRCRCVKICMCSDCSASCFLPKDSQHSCLSGPHVPRFWRPHVATCELSKPSCARVTDLSHAEPRTCHGTTNTTGGASAREAARESKEARESRSPEAQHPRQKPVAMQQECSGPHYNLAGEVTAVLQNSDHENASQEEFQEAILKCARAARIMSSCASLPSVTADFSFAINLTTQLDSAPAVSPTNESHVVAVRYAGATCSGQEEKAKKQVRSSLEVADTDTTLPSLAQAALPSLMAARPSLMAHQ